MIYLFNETNSPLWDVVEKNEQFFRIGLRHKSEEERQSFGIDLTKGEFNIGDFFLDVLEENVVTSPAKKVWALSTACFTLCYNNKSGLPFLKCVEESSFTYDLFILTYSIPDGMNMVFEKNNRFYVLYTKEEEADGVHLVHVIGVAKPEVKPFYYLTYANEDRTKFVTKQLGTVKKTGDVSIFRHEYTKESLESSSFRSTIVGKTEINKIRTAKVLVPFSIIFCPANKPEVMKEICEGRYHRNPKFTTYVQYGDPIDFKRIKETIHKLRDEKYSAATYYIDKPFAEVTEEDMKASPYYFLFRRVNFLCKDGKIKSL